MAMTVGQLKELLAELDDEMPVILSQDSEGNGFSPLVDVEPSWYIAETTYSGDRWWPEDDETEEDAPSDAMRAVLLWPVN